MAHGFKRNGMRSIQIVTHVNYTFDIATRAHVKDAIKSIMSTNALFTFKTVESRCYDSLLPRRSIAFIEISGN